MLIPFDSENHSPDIFLFYCGQYVTIYYSCQETLRLVKNLSVKSPGY